MLFVRSLTVFNLIVGFMVAQPLAGTYTVHPLQPASASNFTSLVAATSALQSNGVSGPVTVEVYDDAGPYMSSVSPLNPNPYGGPNSTSVIAFASWPGVSATNPVTFRAAPGEQPVIDATGQNIGVIWNDASDTTLEGFEIRGATLEAIVIYVNFNVDRIRISRCHIHSCGSSGIALYALGAVISDVVIENCYLHNLHTGPSYSIATGANQNGYISCRRVLNCRLLHNTIVVNTLAKPSGYAIGNENTLISTFYTGITRIEGNIFVSSVSQASIFGFLAMVSLTAPLLPSVSDRNCFWRIGSGPLVTTGTPTSFATLAAWQSGSGLDLNSIVANPNLISTTTSPALSITSPCIAAIPTATQDVTTDYQREIRIGPYDIGADQVFPSSQANILLAGTGSRSGVGPIPFLSAAQNPYLGNLSFAVNVSDASSGTTGLLFPSLGLAPIQYPAAGRLFVYLEPNSLSSLFSSGFGPFPFSVTAGSGTILLPIPAQPSLAGTDIGIQVAIPDPTTVPSFRLTNAALLRLR